MGTHKLLPSPDARATRKRAQRHVRRGEVRRALQLLRESAAHAPNGPVYCWLADTLLAAQQPQEALAALRQALYWFRQPEARPRARTVARLILRLDPSDAAARKKAA